MAHPEEIVRLVDIIDRLLKQNERITEILLRSHPAYVDTTTFNVNEPNYGEMLTKQEHDYREKIRNQGG